MRKHGVRLGIARVAERLEIGVFLRQCRPESVILAACRASNDGMTIVPARRGGVEATTRNHRIGGETNALRRRESVSHQYGTGDIWRALSLHLYLCRRILKGDITEGISAKAIS